MKKTITLLLLFLSLGIAHAQKSEFSKIIVDRLDNPQLELKLNRIALASNEFKVGDKIRIATRFQINDNGELVDVDARAPIPELGEIIVSELKQITISQEMLEDMKTLYNELKFALPVFYQVKKEGDIYKKINKQKKEQEREERKRKRKNQ